MQTGPAVARGGDPKNRDLIRRTASLLSTPMPLHEALRHFSDLLATFIDGSYVSIAVDDGHETGRQFAFLRGVEIGPGAPNVPTESGSALSVPISFGGDVVGTLNVRSVRADAYGADDLALLESCAVFVGARIHDEARRVDREHLLQMAFTDALTGLANRRSYDEALEREWRRCARSGTPLSLLMLDVDFFKIYNDAYGHIAGDGCLKQIARAVAGCAKRPGDLAARYGGEEFAVILPETTAEEAMAVAEEIVAAVRSLELPHQGSSLGYATVSVGCASAVPDASAEPATLPAHADANLYQAKERGRNRVAAESYLSVAPEARRRVTVLHNLPSVRSAFLGREAELAAVVAGLREQRLVTLAGPGGVGKTRLAIEFGHRSLERFPDGVWFVDLAPLADPAFVAPAMLAVLGVREEADRNPDETLTNHLRSKDALLILDNCEHLVAETGRLVDGLLNDCQRLHVIATSREVLAISGETVYRTPTLDGEQGTTLFANRARAVEPSFVVTPENVAIVTQICKRLDGIALAIELAAARIKIMPVQELLKQLPSDETLRGLIEWSYNLLDEPERILLRRLSIFAGGFSLDTATAVCGADPFESDILELLGLLIDKSLVQFEPSDGRYLLLESTKEFGLDLLRDADETTLLQDRRAKRLRVLAERGLNEFRGGAGDRAREEITRDYAEYRAALQWALAEGNDVATGSAIATALGWYWQAGLWSEGILWHERALAREPNEIGRATWALASLGLTNMLHVQGQFGAMGAQGRRAYDAYTALGDVRGQSLARNALAVAANAAGRFEEAREFFQANVSAFREIGDLRLEAITLQNLASLVTDSSDDFAEAERLYERAVRIHRERGDSWMVAAALGGWNTTAAYQGAYDRSIALAREGLDIFRRVGDANRTAEALICIGRAHVWAGEYDAATEPMHEAIAMLRTAPNENHLGLCVDVIAELALARGQPARAAALFAFSDEWRAEKSLPRPASLRMHRESAGSAAREALGPDSFVTAAEQGRVLAPQGALDIAESLLNDQASWDESRQSTDEAAVE